jgi:hypothetical protein
MISNSPPGECGCFLLNAVAATRCFTSGTISQQLFNLQGNTPAMFRSRSNASVWSLTWLALAIPFLMPRRVTVYGQFLAGRMHGFDTYFPRDDAQPNSSANSLALSTGGGVEIGISDWLSVRTVEAEFLSSHLPNDLSGQQHSLRVSAGLIFRFSSNVLNR